MEKKKRSYERPIVVNNDLTEAVFRADDVNIKALKLYAWFLAWNIPADWRQKPIVKESK